ncbi:hypothetical protein M011DRAFT_465504 [Sporormia fimetaria CBS 119925]|uniref:UBC core domain-containing protein n=1 Tax=Sporormia fimetaria CBS 119925 TaxID=1340428 RepID=A0A6A6VJF1_9PLEO|nr:hypothetical protein M011DRAFT_465504 [Sporormia fimetaria CBS 119925]
MPRKAFMSDLQAAAGLSVIGITDVQPGGDDGEFTFRCQVAEKELTVSVQVVPDVSEYPSSHMYLLYAPDDAPEEIARRLSDMNETTISKPIAVMLEMVSQRLKSVDKDGNQQMLHSADYDDIEDSDDEEIEFFPEDNPSAQRAVLGQYGTEPPSLSSLDYRQRIRKDLRAAKRHGFKVGCYGSILDGHSCYVILSCRIAKLGISEEAMGAWQVDAKEYLTVMFHYPSGYKSMDLFRANENAQARRYVSIRMGIGTRYKPTLEEVVNAFSASNGGQTKKSEESAADSQALKMPGTGFRASFISGPLNGLLDERFLKLLQFRYQGMSWEGAELFYNDHANSVRADITSDQVKYYQNEATPTTYPPLVTADHISETAFPADHCFPLVGMQFVLRHFVRCTEFCLICFRRLSEDFQAIKPYVCDNGLCLYQYMSLGFGPSIEHEILSQPRVIDLLVSFCYIRAKSGGLKDFPTGLSLMVPPNRGEKEAPNHSPGMRASVLGQPLNGKKSDNDEEKLPPTDTLKALFNAGTRELMFPDRNAKCPLKKGDWIVIVNGDSKLPLHCRIADITFWPTLSLGEAVYPAERPEPKPNPSHQLTAFKSTPAGKVSTPIGHPGTAVDSKIQKKVDRSDTEFIPVECIVYSSNFDNLDDGQKRIAICDMLDLLPSVNELKSYLLTSGRPPLGSWLNRLPPALLGILRWIIASNRACIMQVPEPGEDKEGAKGRVYGMSGWTQFRFAMGAPDKERRFLRAVKETTSRLSLKYPTIFAWHGSPLNNWHSIIREGLHFNQTLHGRAYGNGVYHAIDANTSTSYSVPYGQQSWPSSELQIGQAMALNELVNAPGEYVSSLPYLVVSQLDWIQTRYLFVRPYSNPSFGHSGTAAPTNGETQETMPENCIQQDPSRTPTGTSSRIVIPAAAMPAGSARTLPAPRTNRSPLAKRRKTGSGNSRMDPIDLVSSDGDVYIRDDDSVATDEEDRALLVDEPEPEPTPPPSRPKTSSKPLTDFVPGTLDYAKLPLIAQPTWATPHATRRLMKDFQELLKVQEREPLHELGWYVDPEKTDNMYQWIVEMHSFDPSLPLAKDMKKKGVKSVVFELRFPEGYPMSPPFVRVIRPRFLPFQSGGGGHVTAGGAMCMQLLTNDGWSAVNSIESVLLQVRMALCSTDPKPARLEIHGRGDYGVGEAVEAFVRACKMHGWTVPAGFDKMALGGQYASHGSHDLPN